MITISPLVSNQIKFLNNKNWLFLLDYRVLGESLEYEIPSMRKYENLLPWILEDQNILVNQYAKKLEYNFHNNLIIVETGEIAKKSLIERYIELNSEMPIDYFVDFIPHPELDVLEEQYNKLCFYRYSDFLKFNNKLLQKEFVSNTPEWKRCTSFDDITLLEDENQRYVKRMYWSGWFTVFEASLLGNSNEFKELFKDPKEWYIERYASWKGMSIQLLKEGQNNCIFWITQQFVKDRKEFYGAECLPLSILEKDAFLKNNLEKTIDPFSKLAIEAPLQLLSPGGNINYIEAADLSKNLEAIEQVIDFIYDKQGQRFFFLEANVRLTSMTIPTLLYNQNVEYSCFYEDQMISDLKGKDYKILSYDSTYDCYDVLIKK